MRAIIVGIYFGKGDFGSVDGGIASASAGAK